jgi:hypothetical protein
MRKACGMTVPTAKVWAAISLRILKTPKVSMVNKMSILFLETKVVSGFPGVGKTHFKTNSVIDVLDSDSSGFSWLEPGVRNPDFPSNYMAHIKGNIGKVDAILVSSHAVVRQALVDNKIPFALVYPDISLKSEYLKRYVDRGSDASFVKMMDENWETFIDQLQGQENAIHVVLQAGEFLRDRRPWVELSKALKLNSFTGGINPA